MSELKYRYFLSKFQYSALKMQAFFAILTLVFSLTSSLPQIHFQDQSQDQPIKFRQIFPPRTFNSNSRFVHSNQIGSPSTEKRVIVIEEDELERIFNQLYQSGHVTSM